MVIFTDARSTGAESNQVPQPGQPDKDQQAQYAQLADLHAKIHAVGIGSEEPKNLTLEEVQMPSTGNTTDPVTVVATIESSNFEKGHEIQVRLIDADTRDAILDKSGKPVSEKVTVPAAGRVRLPPVELKFTPSRTGQLRVAVEVVREPGEVTDKDNIKVESISVVDDKLTILYVEGLPRWEYRYIKNEMIREKTANISCILTSADPSFSQEHSDVKAHGDAHKYRYFPFSQFPNTMDQLMEVDVVLFGDVDPRQFTTAQLKMLNDFVSEKGGGFGMIAGSKYAARRHTAARRSTGCYRSFRCLMTWPNCSTKSRTCPR